MLQLNVTLAGWLWPRSSLDLTPWDRVINPNSLYSLDEEITLKVCIVFGRRNQPYQPVLSLDGGINPNFLHSLGMEELTPSACKCIVYSLGKEE
jgi:hypothetical protein